MSTAITMTSADWVNMLVHFMSLSLLAVGGAITTAPDIHRYLVDDTHWLSESQFSSSISIAQAAPGPNIMFIALMGWNIGLNAAGGLGTGVHAVWLALLGVLIAMGGILIPSATLTYTVAQWGHRNRELRAVKAFKSGMAPIVVALLVATGWLLTVAHNEPAKDWPLWLLAAVSTVVVWRTKTHLLILLAVGAALGAFGLI